MFTKPSYLVPDPEHVVVRVDAQVRRGNQFSHVFLLPDQPLINIQSESRSGRCRVGQPRHLQGCFDHASIRSNRPSRPLQQLRPFVVEPVAFGDLRLAFVLGRRVEAVELGVDQLAQRTEDVLGISTSR
jgi:hypothetical protein